MPDDAPAPRKPTSPAPKVAGGAPVRGDKVEKTALEPAVGRPAATDRSSAGEQGSEKEREKEKDRTSRGTGIRKGPSYMQQVLKAGDLQDMMLGEFRLLRRLGRGGMAEVYLAEQTSLKRNVALKILRVDLVNDDTLIKRFKTEALAAAGLNHPNIVQVYLIGEDRGVEYIVQEYVQGWNLREYITRKGPPDVPLALHILRQTAAALSAAHEAGVVHRDIKPENILLTRKGEVKVADFGLAQLTQHGERLNLTQSGMTMGTPLYMSPEQLSGSKLDARTDLYSLGVTAYHMLTGQPPFQGETALAVALQHMQKDPQPLSEMRDDVPLELCHIVHKMLAKSAEERLGSAQELLRALKRLLAQMTTSNLTPGEFAAQSLTTPWTGKGHSPSSTQTEQGEAAGGGALVAGKMARSGRGVLSQGRSAGTRTSGSHITEVHDVIPLDRELSWRECWRQPWKATWRQQLLPLAVSMLCVATASAGVGWVTRPASPWAKPAVPDHPVPRKESASAQFWHALQQNDEPAWKAVGEFFPQNQLERRRAEQQLALLYLQQQRLQEAQLIFHQFERLPEREAEWRTFGLAGEAVVASLRGEYARSQQLLEQLKPSASHLDRRMRILLTETVLRNQQRGHIPIDRAWRELLRESSSGNG